MSYDVDLVIAGCPHCGRGEQRVLDWNYTSNMSAAWRSAGADLVEYDGKRAEECVPSLRLAIERMTAERAEYARQFDASNGWGSMATLIPALQQMLEAFETYPDGTVRVGR